MVAHKTNPLSFRTKQTEALDEAFETIIDSLEEYVREHDISESEVRYLTKILSEVYLEKRANYFLKERIAIVNRNFAHLLKKLSSDKKADDYPVSVFYYNQKNFLK